VYTYNDVTKENTYCTGPEKLRKQIQTMKEGFKDPNAPFGVVSGYAILFCSRWFSV